MINDASVDRPLALLPAQHASVCARCRRSCPCAQRAAACDYELTEAGVAPELALAD